MQTLERRNHAIIPFTLNRKALTTTQSHLERQRRRRRRGVRIYELCTFSIDEKTFRHSITGVSNLEELKQQR